MTKRFGQAASGRVVIVGGGLARPGAACTLKKRGPHPVLLEASDDVAGDPSAITPPIHGP